MALTKMYKAKVGSPTTVITGNLTASTDVIPVQDIAALTDAPGIATLLDGSGNQEVISYTGISGNDLTGVTRAFEGTAKSWPTGTFISRRLTAYDVNTANANIEDLDTRQVTHAAQHETGGTDEINLAGLEGESAELATHKAESASDDVHGLGNQRGNISDSTDTGVVTTPHTRQVSASVGSQATNSMTSVIASDNSNAEGTRSCVIASGEVGSDGKSRAENTRSMVLGSRSSRALNQSSVVVSSRRVNNNSEESLAGGFAASGTSTSSNRKWHIFSESGNIQHAGTISSGHSFTDYAELFPNLTGEPQGAGLLQTIDGYGVRPANEGEDIIGVTSVMAGVILGDTPFSWQGRWLKDEWGAYITETIPDKDYELQEGETEEDRPLITIPVENPEWNPELPQESRKERPNQWTVVGLVGQLPIRAKEDVQPMDYIKAWQDGVGQKSSERTNVRVMKIIQEYDEQKGYAIAFCFIK